MKSKGFSSLLLTLLISLVAILTTFVFIKYRKGNLPPESDQQIPPLTSLKQNTEEESGIPDTLKGNIYIYGNSPDTPIRVDSIEFYLVDSLGTRHACDVTKLSYSQYLTSLEDLRKGLLTVYIEVEEDGRGYPNLQNNFSYIIHTSKCKTQKYNKIGVKINYNPSYLSTAPKGIFEKVLEKDLKDMDREGNLYFGFVNLQKPYPKNKPNNIPTIGPNEKFTYEGDSSTKYRFKFPTGIKAKFYGEDKFTIDDAVFEIYPADSGVSVIDWWKNGAVAELGGYDKEEVNPYYSALNVYAVETGKEAYRCTLDNLGNINEVLLVTIRSDPVPSEVEWGEYSLPLSNFISNYYYYNFKKPFVIRYVWGTTGACMTNPALSFLSKIQPL